MSVAQSVKMQMLHTLLQKKRQANYILEHTQYLTVVVLSLVNIFMVNYS